MVAVQSGISGTLRLGTEPTASTSQALPVAAFCAAHPLAKVQVDSRLSTTKLLETADNPLLSMRPHALKPEHL